MISWINRAFSHPIRPQPLVNPRKRRLLALEELEDRVTPAIAAPTLLDPATAVRVDQGSYELRGILQVAAPTSVLAFRDRNLNGRFDAGVDPQAGSDSVARGETDFTINVRFAAELTQPVLHFRGPGRRYVPPGQDQAHHRRLQGPQRRRHHPPRPGVHQREHRSLPGQFSEGVTGVDASDFQVVTSGTASAGPVALSGSGTTYITTVSGVSGDGTLRLNLIDDDTIKDILTKAAQAHALGGAGAGNGNFTTGQQYTIDTTDPIVESITRLGSPAAVSGEVQFQVKFSEAVQGVDVADFVLAGSLTGAAIAGLTGSGATYTVTVNTGVEEGFLRLDLIDNNTVTDLAGRLLGGPALGDGAFISGESIVVLGPDGDRLATIVVPNIDLNLLGLHARPAKS